MLVGVVAWVTAMSVAEISSAFPESGGAYTFAKKVLSVRAAFAVGWVLWFAYIVAGVLYALAFASFRRGGCGRARAPAARRYRPELEPFFSGGFGGIIAAMGVSVHLAGRASRWSPRSPA
jgi:amino acid transporter